MKNRASYTLEIFNFFSCFYHFGYHCIHLFLSFILSSSFFWSFQVSFFNHFLNHIFFIFLSCFIIFSSSGAKIFQKMENYNVPRLFFICLSFFHFLSCFYHFCFQWWNWWKMIKNDEKWLKTMIKIWKTNEKKQGKLQFSKKWKIAIFLEFFSFFLCLFIFSWFFHFLSFFKSLLFNIFASSGGIDAKW